MKNSGRKDASLYDSFPWTQEYPAGLDPAALQKVAQFYGACDRFDDILDLGCGTGDLLLRAGAASAGRLVGVEMSGKSCEIASRALSNFGDRVQIIHDDFLALKARTLGQFDLIYCTGVIFFLEPERQSRLVELMSACLRPGGVALVSYYTGLAAAVRSHVAKTLRANVEDIGDIVAAAAEARSALDMLRPATDRPSQFVVGLRRAFAYFDSLPDTLLVFEALDAPFESISTAQLSALFRRGSTLFATYLDYDGFWPEFSDVGRALMADRLDLATGGFRYSVFVKPLGKATHGTAVPAPTKFPVYRFYGRLPLRAQLRSLIRRALWLSFRI